MNEKTNESLFIKQKNIRPKIGDVITYALEGSELNNAQDFILYLCENKLTPRWASVNSWKVSFENKGVCYIRLPGVAHYNIKAGAWHLAIFTQYDNHLNDLVKGEPEKIKGLVKNHIDNNLPCGGCMPGLNRRSVNKEFVNICACTCINMESPDDVICGFAKKLIALRCDAIINARVPKCNYLKPVDRT